ncbi:MAG: hypothetical protein AB7O78_07315 [Thermoleophilia bacterium]
MTPEQALATRRLLLVVAGLSATLGAHAVCAEGVGLTRAAPAVWGSVACLAVLLGPRRRARWRAWSPAGTLGRLVAVEVAAHAALTAAPWAFGVTVHHQPPLLSGGTLAVHAAAAAVLTVALLRAQRVLGVLVRFVRRLRRAFSPRRPRPAGHRALAPPVPLLRARPRSRPAGARGPPITAV